MKQSKYPANVYRSVHVRLGIEDEDRSRECAIPCIIRGTSGLILFPVLGAFGHTHGDLYGNLSWVPPIDRMLGFPQAKNIYQLHLLSVTWIDSPNFYYLAVRNEDTAIFP